MWPARILPPGLTEPLPPPLRTAGSASVSLPVPLVLSFPSVPFSFQFCFLFFLMTGGQGHSNDDKEIGAWSAVGVHIRSLQGVVSTWSFRQESVSLSAPLMGLSRQEQGHGNSALCPSVALGSEKPVSGRMGANRSASREGQTGC